MIYYIYKTNEQYIKPYKTLKAFDIIRISRNSPIPKLRDL
jgi:hypothetical protein